MNNTTRNLLFGCILFSAPWLAVQAGDRWSYDYARVIEARPIHETVRVPYPVRRCRTERVTREQPDRRNYAGAIVGGIVGGVIGNQVVHGDHREWGTVAGAAIGATVGHRLDRGRDRAATHLEERCRTVHRYRNQERVVGYRVRYRYAGRTHVTRMDHDPGRRVRVAVSARVAE